MSFVIFAGALLFALLLLMAASLLWRGGKTANRLLAFMLGSGGAWLVVALTLGAVLNPTFSRVSGVRLAAPMWMRVLSGSLLLVAIIAALAFVVYVIRTATKR